HRNLATDLSQATDSSSISGDSSTVFSQATTLRRWAPATLASSRTLFLNHFLELRFLVLLRLRFVLRICSELIHRSRFFPLLQACSDRVQILGLRVCSGFLLRAQSLLVSPIQLHILSSIIVFY
ncbi:unnamed protein product, partial [Ilex paraguariensis]